MHAETGSRVRDRVGSQQDTAGPTVEVSLLDTTKSFEHSVIYEIVSFSFIVVGLLIHSESKKLIIKRKC